MVCGTHLLPKIILLRGFRKLNSSAFVLAPTCSFQLLVYDYFDL
jgi:hypothetical protein